jgi:hypothetical protein
MAVPGINKIPIILSVFIIGCSQDQPLELAPEDILHRNQDQLTQVIIYDMFPPPVASRIYMYSSLAAFEAIRFQKEGTLSIAENLTGFDTLPTPVAGKTYDFNLAACKAFFEVAHKVRVFSVDSLKEYEDFLFGYYAGRLDDSTYKWSVSFGEEVAEKILKRAANDGYTFSRGKPKYLGSNEPGKWRTTPPDYLDGSEAYWNTIRPVSIDSASCFRPGPPPVFSLDTGSVFFRSVREVYHHYKNLTDEQMLIATYWDDNPLVLMHSGHLMFANKKITPGGHWMGICAIASKQSGADAVSTAAAYALTSIALFDGFIACWDEKYNSHYIRPVTVINETIDPTWMPYLQTPPFPEYPSGHSTITAAAATVLTSIFGENFAFRDTSDLRYIGLERSFSSFNEAAAEASISRLYGGIHFRFSIDSGAALGNRLGEHILNKLRIKSDDLAGK